MVVRKNLGLNFSSKSLTNLMETIDRARKKMTYSPMTIFGATESALSPSRFRRGFESFGIPLPLCTFPLLKGQRTIHYTYTYAHKGTWIKPSWFLHAWHVYEENVRVVHAPWLSEDREGMFLLVASTSRNTHRGRVTPAASRFTIQQRSNDPTRHV